MTWPAGRIFAWLLLGVVVLAALGLALAVAVPQSTTFNVTAETEWLEMVIEDRAPSRWSFADEAELFEDDPDHITKVTGYLELAPHVRVLVERVSLGPLFLYLNCLPDEGQTKEAAASRCSSVGRTLSPNDEPLQRLGKRATIKVPRPASSSEAGHSVLFPVAGRVVAGRTVGIEVGETTAILRGGRVSMLGLTAFRKNVFEAGGLNLEAGDRFDVLSPNPESPTLGFIVSDERPAMTAAYRIKGTSARITRPGGTSYNLSASLVSRLFADELFIAISAFLAFCATASTLLSVALQVWPGSHTATEEPAAIEPPVADVPTPRNEPTPLEVVVSRGIDTSIDPALNADGERDSNGTKSPEA